MSKLKRRTFSQEFKIKIVQHKLLGNMKTSEICKMHDLDRQTIHIWVDEYNKHAEIGMSGKGVVPGRDLEIYQRNKELEMENEILKKAEAYFAKKIK